ncbi:hypothetical protein C5B42_03600 [Candidatus Cerribacteria bacterium 'Amazon FNV 2010 28 9']|uniref:Uncharacterized protein n=1 Tax=Candidatus Cerribacteria bacterium 'Amazon FNV 2010 28 9' TaxID=2081795 RepID=A0A317JR43_9BACT|nr:MAG: hypothetical protein C5B42_03600 [Candidatus Cerribacteria bacterium 'Amazon FNV 2010 28 9']
MSIEEERTKTREKIAQELNSLLTTFFRIDPYIEDKNGKKVTRGFLQLQARTIIELITQLTPQPFDAIEVYPGVLLFADGRIYNKHFQFVKDDPQLFQEIWDMEVAGFVLQLSDIGLHRGE